MDLWTFNKLAAAVLLSLLVLVGGNTAISILYPQGTPGEFQVAEVEEGGQTADQDETETQPEPLPVRLAAAEASAGEGTARACTACHSFEEGGPNKVGPNLYGVPGREVASVEDFSYSGALEEFGGEWTYERLDCFLENPSECVSGTSMGYAGIQDPAKRADLIAYLASLGDTPPFPEPEEESQTADAASAEEGDAAGEAEADEAAGDERAAEAEQSSETADAGETAEQDGGEDAARSEEASETAAADATSTGEQESDEDASAEGEDGGDQLAAMFENADASAGENGVRVCAACHTFEEGGPNRVGPNLYGIVGQEVASAEDFNYSDALKQYGGEWTYEKLNCYLENPKDCVPGNKMTFAGVKDDAKRADIIAYLASLGEAPPLPGAERDTGQAGSEKDAAKADGGQSETRAARLGADTAQ
ncbi:MAG: c-type cytochrome [Dichotomicrobium sp.]